MTAHPYADLPTHAKWSRAVGKVPPAEVDPVVRGKFKIDQGDKVVTAGSCFAQHIANRLAGSGFNFHITEKHHPMVIPELAKQYGFGVFSARYGNVYTSRQLLQLLQRAQGKFQPKEDHWTDDHGRFFDPFRPSIQPGGFGSIQELHLDRKKHLAATLQAFAEMDVFVFTLGLTECWIDNEDGAVFPTCPGVIAGTFDPARYSFLNLGVDDVVADVSKFLSEIRKLNPGIRTILTVSPVPLAATALDRHVLTSTTLSKSVLRVAAEVIEQSMPNSVAYFPSYEIITGNYSRGAYYAGDLRNVLEDGVDHVMRLFFRHYTNIDQPSLPVAPAPEPGGELAEMRRLVEVDCEESFLDADAQAHSTTV